MFTIPIQTVSKPSPWEALLSIPFKFEKSQKTKHEAKRCANIITFDIETTTFFTDFITTWGFNHKDYAANPSKYDEAAKFALMYVWQFAIESGSDILVFMGRTWDECRDFFDKLQKCIACAKYGIHASSFDELDACYDNIRPGTTRQSFSRVQFRVYVHNLGYEFQFLRNIFEYDFAYDANDRKAPVFARNARKPMRIQFNFRSASVIFHDTYVLTQKSLKTWCKDAELPTVKLDVPEGYYDVIRTPLTPLTDFEVQYSINDVVSMVYGIDLYRQKYGTLTDIPMTQTGEVRRKCVANVALANPEWSAMCANISATMEFDFFRTVTHAFGGGWTHANAAYTGRTMHNVRCFDFASDYPFCMCCFRYPVSPYVRAKAHERQSFLDDLMSTDPRSIDVPFKYYIHFTADAVLSRTSCTFWSSSKVEAIEDVVEDNGKIFSASHVDIIMTGDDFHIFSKAYKFANLNVVDIWRAEAGFLPKELVTTILDYYHKKTTLKGLPDRLSEYVESKQFINSIYGVAVTRIIADDVEFRLMSDETDDYAEWVKTELTAEDYEEKRQAFAKSTKEFMTYPIGTYVTAYARSSLWGFILQLDKHVVYGDTDSLKGTFDADDIAVIDAYNAWVEQREREIADIHGFDEALFHPVDTKGIEHRLGIFDEEDACEEFRTLGAKRYVDTIRVPAGKYNPDKMKAVDFYDNGDAKVIQATVAGLPKRAAVSILDSVDDFTPGTFWDTEHAAKQMSIYFDDMPSGLEVVDHLGIAYQTGDEPHGIALMATTFDLEHSDAYSQFLAWFGGYTEDDGNNTPAESKIFR